MKKMTRLLCLLLCAVLVCGMLPPAAVSAAEAEPGQEDGWKYVKEEETEEEAPAVELPAVEEKEEAPALDVPTEDEYGDWDIESFADLKEALSKPIPEGESWLRINYNGTEPMVITEDITIPTNYDVYVRGTLQIPQGVTVTIEDSGYLSTDVLQIDGTLKMLDYANAFASDKLVVNGTFQASFVGVNLETKIEGFDKIQWKKSYYGITISGHSNTVEEFYKVLADMSSQLGERIDGYLYFRFDEDVVLDKSFTVPSGMQVTFEGEHSVTVDSGCTVTLEESGYIWNHAKLILKGTISIAEDSRVEISGSNGHLEFAGGKVTGKGYVQVWAHGVDPASNFTGLDTSKYELIQIYPEAWSLHNIEGLTKLAAPAAPKWGIRYEFKWNNDTDKYDVKEFASPTSIALKGMDNAKHIAIKAYFEGSDGPEQIVRYTWEGVSGDVGSLDIFQDADRPSGVYYFTVQAIGDYETTRSSDIITSEKYTYTNPGKRLDKVSNLKAENDVITWDAHPQADLIDFYTLNIWFAPTAEAEPENMWWELDNEDNSAVLPEYIKQNIGEGYYYFEVVAYPKDATKFILSEAAMSNAMKVEIPETVRHAGADRFETSFKVADAIKKYSGENKFQFVIVASGANFADALAGSYLSYWYGAPILLSYKEKQNNQVKDYIKANLAENGTVFILGGESAVPKSMEVGLEAYEVIRLAGDNRFLTNLKILEKTKIPEGAPILVATGSNFADSLSASAVGLPILLVHKKLTAEQKAFLAKAADPKKNPIIILGGKNAVNETVEGEFKALGFNVERLAGDNRFQTSIMIAEKFFEDPTTVVLAYAWNYPDGLCGGGLAVWIGAPLILTMDKQVAVAAEYAKKVGIERTVTLGGEGLISDAAVNTILGK